MESLLVTFAAADPSGLPADDLAVGLAICEADGRLRRANATLHALLGCELPPGPQALAAGLLAAGVGEPQALLAAAEHGPRDLTLRRGGRTIPLRLSGHRLPDGGLLYLLHELRDAAAARDRLAQWQSLIAHDLRSPLAVIQGYAGLLATGQPGPLNPTQAEFLAGIDAKIVELGGLLDDFLDLSRLEAGALELRPERLRLAEVVERACADQRRAARSRGIEVTAVVDPEDLALEADGLRLGQVLANLVGNAVKYNHDGGWVRVEARADGDAVELQVRDGGPGIAEAELAAIFEPFVRGGGRGDAAGSGLGLAVVERLVTLHGGSIAASSEHGQGAVFTLRLPRQPAPAAVPAAVDPEDDGDVQ